jgi:hypothetical protein
MTQEELYHYEVEPTDDQRINIFNEDGEECHYYDLEDRDDIDIIVDRLNKMSKEIIKFRSEEEILKHCTEYMSVKEVSHEIKRCSKTINRMLNTGILKGMQRKKGNLITKQSVKDWLIGN